jgi:glycosyltransferase involved in cell wall biosynthesis
MVTVSVVVPTYNMSQYLEECLNSVLEQSFRDCEVIVVDDGSTDGTADVEARFGSRIRYQRQENGGVAEALNTGIAMANGEYVALLAADDALCAESLALRVWVLDRNPNVGMVSGSALMVDEEGEPQWPHRPIRGEGATHQPSETAVRYLLSGNAVVCSSVMMRRSVLEGVGGFRQESMPGEDWEMWLRIAGVSDVVYLSRPLARVRMHDESLTAKFTVESVEAAHSKILRHLFDEKELAGFEHLRDYAYSAHYRTLARVAAHLRQRGQFAKYMALALREQPGLLAERCTYETLYGGAKTLVPSFGLTAARAVRRALKGLAGRGRARLRRLVPRAERLSKLAQDDDAAADQDLRSGVRS